MKKLTFIIMSLLMTICIKNEINAQLDSNLTISGSVDVYFRANINSTNNPGNVFIGNNGNVTESTVAPGTSFANLPGFSLGMANFIAFYEGEKTGVVADLVFGPRGADAVFASEAPLNIVNQLYIYWNLSDKVRATIGNFNTFLGYEVISPTANFNYSTSYMFSYGPFSHSGLKLDFDLGGGFTLMTALLNPTDATDFNPSGEYVGGVQLGYSNDAGGAWLNVLADDDFFQIDLTTGWQATDKVYVGLNTTSAKDNFFGLAGYLQLAISPELSWGVRAEYFQDKGLGLLALDESVIDFTVSANYKVGNMTIIPEIRLDAFSQDNYVIKDAAGAKMASSLSSFVLAAVYGF